MSLNLRVMSQNQKEAGGMRTPHRRDISARQDVLGRELRQLFDDYVQEDVPDDLMLLAQKLQSAGERQTAPDAAAEKPPEAVADDRPQPAKSP